MVKVQLTVNTPPGQATRTKAMFQRTLLKLKRPLSSQVNESDDQIIMMLEVNEATAVSIKRTVDNFDQAILDLWNRVEFLAIRKMLSNEQQTELLQMFLQQTTATYEELSD